MKILSNLKIAGKLYLLIVLAMLGMLTIAGVGQYQLGKVFDSANYASINTVPSFNTLNDARVAFNRIRTYALYHVLATSDTKMVEMDRQIQERREVIDKAITYYRDKLISDEEDRRLLDKSAAAVKEYYLSLDVAMMLSRKNAKAEATEALEKAAPKVDKVAEVFDQIIDYNEKLAKESSVAAQTLRDRASLLAWVLVVLTLALLGTLGWLIANRELAQPIGDMVDNLKQLANGSMAVDITGTERSDEIGDIARAGQVFKEFVLKLDTQSWIKTHTSEISTALQQAEDFRALTQTAVSKIAPAMGAGHGAFYVLEGDGRFNLLASYGYRERKHLNSSFAVGEGLVGQCAMEKTSIMLTAPKDYIRINSGLGEGPPACIIVQPIIHNDRVLGVLEMASFQQFSEREKAVLEALQPVLATSMEILDRNLKTRELLAATQEQAERMEKQAAQMEEQSVEMEAQQAARLETENWFRSIIETAPDGMLVTDAAGQILLTNPELERIFGYAPGELVGGNIEQLVPESVRGGHEGLRRTFMTDGRTRTMGSGSTLHGRCKDGSETTVAVTLAPLPPRGARGKCVSVSVRAIDSRLAVGQK